MLNSIEFEILKRVRYGLSLEGITNSDIQLEKILITMKLKGIIELETGSDIYNPVYIYITKKGERMFAETEYVPKFI